MFVKMYFSNNVTLLPNRTCDSAKTWYVGSSGDPPSVSVNVRSLAVTGQRLQSVKVVQGFSKIMLVKNYFPNNATLLANRICDLAKTLCTCSSGVPPSAMSLSGHLQLWVKSRSESCSFS